SLVMVFGGCATMGDVLDAKSEGRGTERLYPVPAHLAWGIARTVFRWEGAAAIEEHRAEGYMLTTLGQRTYAGAWISSRGPDSSAVLVITKSLSPFTELTETRFHLDFAAALEYWRAGQPIPARVPTATEVNCVRYGAAVMKSRGVTCP